MIDPAQMLAYQRLAETGLSARELLEMDMSEYARATGRATPVQAALRALDAQHEEPQPVEPVFSETVTSPEPQGLDPDSPDYFLAWRQNRASGGEGVGIFSGMGSQSAEYRSSARKHAGRTALGNANVVEAPKLTGRQERQGDMIDPRTRAERFGTPGNSNTF
jgi:hypothetical protein